MSKSQKGKGTESGLRRLDPAAVSDDHRERLTKQQAFTSWYEEALEIFTEENARLSHEEDFGDEVEYERIAASPR